MEIDQLDAITPIDGRYRKIAQDAAEYLSEYALMRRRIKAEITFLKHFITLAEPALVEELPENWVSRLDTIGEKFSREDARRVKELEKRLGHDVGAVMEYLRGKLHEEGLGRLAPFIHFGLTSEDVNNIAYSTMLRDFSQQLLIPEVLEFLEKLSDLAQKHKGSVMLGRTHGQPAIPTTLGKFLANYVYRVAKLAEEVSNHGFYGKIGGAVGDNAALKAVYPDVDWVGATNSIVKQMGLEPFPANTQILPHEGASLFFSKLAVMAGVLSNLCRDLWLLGMLEHVGFSRHEEEIHSSTMPHKANPLMVENAEGCFDLSGELLSYLSRRLLASRLHRDLSDSIIKRFYGTPLTLLLIGLRNLRKALETIAVNVESMRREVDAHQEVFSEPLQLILRKHGIEEAHKIIGRIKPGDMREVLENINAPKEVEQEVKQILAEGYTGYSEKLAEQLLKDAAIIIQRLKQHD
ncbi:MAG: lyase family protein [Aigarchaeota archaeon]|nr:lyase family protein [Candidatus Pelearchaeum maunauluense]